MSQQIRTNQHVIDYARSGLSIQQSILAEASSTKPRQGPLVIRWGELLVQTSDAIAVPASGRFRLEFLAAGPLRQGFDVKVNGAIRLADGREVNTLRTWRDDELEDVVEYEFTSRDGKMWVWNVYEVNYPSGQTAVAKWSDNAGFWVETEAPGQFVYHCSAGTCNPPDFSSLRVRLTIAA